MHLFTQYAHRHILCTDMPHPHHPWGNRGSRRGSPWPSPSPSQEQRLVRLEDFDLRVGSAHELGRCDPSTAPELGVVVVVVVVVNLGVHGRRSVRTRQSPRCVCV
jgi:hypothetical protein